MTLEEVRQEIAAMKERQRKATVQMSHYLDLASPWQLQRYACERLIAKLEAVENEMVQFARDLQDPYEGDLLFEEIPTEPIG